MPCSVTIHYSPLYTPHWPFFYFSKNSTDPIRIQTNIVFYCLIVLEQPFDHTRTNTTVVFQLIVCWQMAVWAWARRPAARGRRVARATTTGTARRTTAESRWRKSSRAPKRAGQIVSEKTVDFDAKNVDFDVENVDFKWKTIDFDVKNVDFDAENTDFNAENVDFDAKSVYVYWISILFNFNIFYCFFVSFFNWIDIELRNIGQTSVDLTGCYFLNGTIPIRLFFCCWCLFVATRHRVLLLRSLPGGSQEQFGQRPVHAAGEQHGLLCAALPQCQRWVFCAEKPVCVVGENLCRLLVKFWRFVECFFEWFWLFLSSLKHHFKHWEKPL